MTNPLFWLVLSLLFVTASLTIVLVVAIPALRELARAARSAEKLFDTLRREFPPTLEAIRLTGLEITDLKEDVSDGVQSAGNVVRQVDESLAGVRQQAQKMRSGTRNLLVGVKVAWRTFTRSPKPISPKRTVERLPPPRSDLDFDLPPQSEPYPVSESNSAEATLLENSSTLVEPPHLEPDVPAQSSNSGSLNHRDQTDTTRRTQTPRPERYNSQVNITHRDLPTIKPKSEPSPESFPKELER